MDILRWILIVAGIAILAMLYFQGRPGMGRPSLPGRSGAGSRAYPGESHLHDPGGHERGMNNMGRSHPDDPLMNDPFDAPGSDPLEGFGQFDDVFDEYSDELTQQSQADLATAHPDRQRDRPGEHPGGRVARRSTDPAHDFEQAHEHENRGEAEDEFGQVAPRGRSGLAARIEAISARLAPGRTERLRRARGNGNDHDGAEDSYDSKIVTLHVVAPDEQIIDGMSLAQAFEARGYEFGEMDIFHSRYDGKALFSIVKAVEPGTFDCSDVASFDTPGVSLILQLPGPVPADVAFQVLVTEARELADMLGCSVLDAERSTLSRQSLQHMRESINQYMHRQKYFQGVPS